MPTGGTSRCFDFVVWLDVPFEETARRMAVRDGTSTVDAASVTVAYDGIAQPTGWTLTGDATRIAFSPRPTPGTVVTVSYGLRAGACP